MLDHGWKPHPQEFAFEGGFRESPVCRGHGTGNDDLVLKLQGDLQRMARDLSIMGTDMAGIKGKLRGLEERMAQQETPRTASVAAGDHVHIGYSDVAPCDPAAHGTSVTISRSAGQEEESDDMKPTFEPEPGMTVYERLTWNGPFNLIQPYESATQLQVDAKLPGDSRNSFHKVPLDKAWVVRDKGNNLLVKPLATLTDEKPPRGMVLGVLSKLTPTQWALAAATAGTMTMSAAALLRTF